MTDLEADMRFHQLPPTLRIALTTAAATLATGSALRADARDDDLAALREQIRQLDQKLRVLERQSEIRDEADPAAAKTAARVAVTDKGVSLSSADGANALRLRGLVQADSRWFLDSGFNPHDAFVLRRARIILEGTFNRFAQYQLVPEFGGTSGNGSLTLLDANLTLAFAPALQLRAGRFRAPVGLEQLQSDAVAFFAERSIVSQFVPNRDLGVQLGGDLLGGAVSYAAGVFNGVPDGASNSNNAENNNQKDFVARLFFTPFKSDPRSLLRGLGFGLAGSIGRQNGAASGTLTSGYRTDGQQTFFSYRSTTVAEGATSRLSPQAYFYRGPFGAQAEYVVSSVEVVNGAARRSLAHRAWQVSAGYVLTGEDAGYLGVVPQTALNLAAGTWGAFEIVGRVSGADLDDDAFTGGSASVANPATSATKLSTFAFGVNWYLTKSVRASLDYFHTKFDAPPGVAPASNTVIGGDEDAFVTRLQLAF